MLECFRLLSFVEYEEATAKEYCWPRYIYDIVANGEWNEKQMFTMCAFTYINYCTSPVPLQRLLRLFRTDVCNIQKLRYIYDFFFKCERIYTHRVYFNWATKVNGWNCYSQRVENLMHEPCVIVGGSGNGVLGGPRIDSCREGYFDRNR